MAKTIFWDDNDVAKYATLSDVLQFKDLDIVNEAYDETTNTIIFSCKHSWNVGICEECGHLTDKIHSYQKQRTIHDAPVRGCHTKLIFDSVRLECHVCHNVFTLPVRDVVPDCTYTYRLSELIADPSRKQDCATLAHTFNLGYKLVEGILLKAAEDKLNDRKEEPIQVRLLGIDEISNKKGHGGYVLILTDLERRVLLDILPDRQKDTLKEWLKSPVEGVKLDELSQVAIDLWAQYRDAVGEVFEDVLVVADRFHVVQNLNKAIDEERRQAQREAESKEEKSKLKGLRFLLKKKKDKLTDSEKKRLEQLKQTHPKLYQLWLMREKLYEWYQTDTTSEVAKESLSEWIKEAKKLGLEHLNSFCKTLLTYKSKLSIFSHTA